MSEIIEDLQKALLDYDAEAAERLARQAVEEGLDPIVIGAKGGRARFHI